MESGGGRTQAGLMSTTTSPSEPDVREALKNIRRLARVGQLDLAADLAFSSLRLEDVESQDDADPEATARLGVLHSSILLTGGHAAESVAAAELVLSATTLPDELARAGELALLRGLTALGENERAWQHFGQILAGSAGDGALPGALAAGASLAWADGRVAEAVELCRSAIRRADRTGNSVISARSRLQLATMLTSLGEFVAAAELLAIASDQVERHDVVSRGAIRLIGARLELAAGNLDQAAERAREGLALVDRFGGRLYAPIGRSVLGSVGTMREDLEATTGQPDQCSGPSAPPVGLLGWAGCIWAEAHLVEARHGRRAALDVIDAACTSPANVNRLLLEEPSAAAWWVRCAIAEGDRWSAAAVVASAQVLGETNLAYPTLAAAAAHARGVFWRDLGALEEAIAAYRQPWAEASAAEDAGVTSTDPNAVARKLSHALTLYERVGATRDARRVKARACPPTSRQRRRNRARPISGWASLTATEHQICVLVAQGLTNARTAEELYLSRHTVDFHLRQIYRKLAINSRGRVDPTRGASGCERDDATTWCPVARCWPGVGRRANALNTIDHRKGRRGGLNEPVVHAS